jgi:hypothetical protein
MDVGLISGPDIIEIRGRRVDPLRKWYGNREKLGSNSLARIYV